MDESALKLYRQVEANLTERKNFDESAAILDSMLAENIDRASALYYLGIIAMERTQFAIGKEYFNLALIEKPGTPQFVNNLACCYQELANHLQAIDLFKLCLAINPNDTTPHNNLAVCYVHMGDLKKALPHAEEAYKAEPDEPSTKHNLGQIYLGLGRYKEGFELYDARLDMPDRKERFYTADKSDKYWDGTKGINLLVHGEQGLGDELMFASMLPDAMRDCNVIFDCNSRLLNIMRESFPGIPIYGTKQQNGEVAWYGNHKVDAKISIGSLARFYRRNEWEFPRKPYLKADPALIQKYKKKLAALGSRPKIGISWYGGAKRTSQSYRFNPLSNWLDIFNGFDCDFISLQYNKEAGEKVERFNKETGTNIIHWQDALDDYDDTAALLMNLDLVISAPQSVVHLAGALGVNCWRLCAYQSMWLHGEHGKDAPWYGTVKNYWQGKDYDWKPVMKRVYNDLAGIYDLGHVQAA